MTKTFTMTHTLNASVPEFWERIFASESFNEELYRDELGFQYKLEEWDAETGLRRARVWPTADVPKPVAAVLGDKLSFLEEGVYDAAADRYDFVVIPSAMRDRITTTGIVIAEATDDGRCKRTVTITVEARIFGVGKLVEAHLESTTRDQYDRNAAFANEYLSRQ